MPRYQCDHLGTISCMAAGKIMEKNMLCVVCAEGECHLFDLDHGKSHQYHPQPRTPTHQQTPSEDRDVFIDDEQNLSTDNSLDEEDEYEDTHATNLTLPIPKREDSLDHTETITVDPFMTQRIPCNITCVTLADFGNTNSQLVFAGTDRNVYLYKYEQQTTGEWNLVQNRKIPMHDNQINSLGRHLDPLGKEGILIGFVTGGYAYMPCDTLEVQVFAAEKRRRRYEEDEDVDSQSSTKPITVLGNAFGSLDTCAFAELGGRLSVHDPLVTSSAWSLDLKQEVLSVCQAELIKKSDTKQLVLATWDGVTYIIDRERNAVCFNFKERICAFACGMYSPTPHKPPVTCLVYVPFADSRIVVYHDVMLDSVPSRSLVEQMAFSTSAIRDLKKLYANTNMSDDEMRRHLPELTHLFYSCLYNFSSHDEDLLRNEI